MKENNPYMIAVIPAKKESIRLPNKNMTLLLEKPLLHYTIQEAKKSKWIHRIYVSTDSIEILNYAKKEGVEVILRPTELGGETPLMDVYFHALQHLKDEHITHMVGLQPDHPDRKIQIDEAIRYALEKKLDDVISIDSNGYKNGSFRILKTSALKNGKISVYLGATTDDATNIHTIQDLRLAGVRLHQKDHPFIIQVKNKAISKHSPTFIVAEGACNHMCDLNLAKKMIDEALAMGADAIKFQTYKAERLVAKEAQSYWNYGTKISQFQYYKNLDKFDVNEYRILFDYAKDKNIIVFSTPFDIQSAEMLNDLDMPLFKIASCSITDLKLIQRIARFQKPMIVSTGGSETNEIREAVETIYAENNFQVIVLACTLSYPAKNSDANLLRIPTLCKLFPEVIVGLSDHTEPDEQMIIPSIGVSLGAKVVEKHFTLDRTFTGSGHAFSVDPLLLKKMINNIRLTEEALGTAEIAAREVEKKARESARLSIVAARNLRKGEILELQALTLKRPGTGIMPKYIDDIIGKKVLRNIESDETLHWKDIDLNVHHVET